MVWIFKLTCMGDSFMIINNTLLLKLLYVWILNEVASRMRMFDALIHPIFWIKYIQNSFIIALYIGLFAIQMYVVLIMNIVSIVLFWFLLILSSYSVSKSVIFVKLFLGIFWIVELYLGCYHTWFVEWLFD